ncbi:MAG: Unknown protein [uncultured Sulfurovum sp.]|uniref:Uncharacterized protein n=1 Tax=uncultured Sulfurovum sp. TaxID=269237 RepID=A0A6S6SGM8_9BACT|nr:MAG: Unknown protein [uncultured Sulfurovum sp.]
MKYLSKTILPIISISTLLLLNSCSKPEVVSVSKVHPYGHNFGLVQNPHADAIIQQEQIAMSQPNEIEMPLITDPSLTTELTKDPDAFYAEEYVPTAPIITYKYPFDSEFYSKAEWRTMELQ